MSLISHINTEEAPQPIGPYVQAVRAGEFLYLSGAIGLHPHSGLMIQVSIEDETTQVLANLSAVLSEGHASWDQVVKCTIYLTSMDYFSSMNEVYARVFSGHKYPARETIAVLALPKGARVEISVVAYLG